MKALKHSFSSNPLPKAALFATAFAIATSAFAMEGGWDEDFGPEISPISQFQPGMPRERAGSVTAEGPHTPVDASGHRGDDKEETKEAAKPDDNSVLRSGAEEFDRRSHQIGQAPPDQAALVTGEPIRPTIIAAGHSHSLCSDGRQLYLWGANGPGQLGDGDADARSIPWKKPFFKGVIKGLAAGAEHTMVLTEEGKVYSWGGNSCGQSGVRGGVSRLEPLHVWLLLGSVTQIATGAYHSLALMQSGRVYAWGYGLCEKKPPHAVQVAGWGNYGCVQFGHMLLDDGRVIGLPEFQANQPDPAPRVPRPEPQIMSHVPESVQIAAGGYNSVALTSDGRIYRWHRRTGPEEVFIGEKIVQVAAGENVILALTDEDVLWAWDLHGNNEMSLSSSAPKRIKFKGRLGRLKQIAAGPYHAWALTEQGELFAWATKPNEFYSGICNFYVATGLRAEPTQIRSGVAKIAVNDNNSLALTEDGLLFAWGPNRNGEAGDGTHAPAWNFVQVKLPEPASLPDQIPAPVISNCSAQELMPQPLIAQPTPQIGVNPTNVR